MYESLVAQYREQDPDSIFAHFGYDGASGECFWAPYERLANMAKTEDWDFQTNEFKTGDYPILRNYLNYTFLRLQQQNHIQYSGDGTRACFNTGLQTPTEKDIFALFYKNKNAKKYRAPQWTLYGFVDSYSPKLQDFHPLPPIAEYYSDTNELVFDLSYGIEINFDHILKENRKRLPGVLQENPPLALASIEGATKFLKEKIKRNYKIAIPHWYSDRVQLLLPLNLLNESKADLALVADKDKIRKIYRITTILTMDMAYIDARLICYPDKAWLNP